MATIKPFLEQGNFITMHRLLFDVVMPQISPNAWKVLCLIVRQTVGWNKDSDMIAYSQIRAMCGIKGDATIARSVKELVGHSIITAHRGDRQKDGRLGTTTYSLNLNFSITDEPSSENEVASENEETINTYIRRDDFDITKISKGTDLFEEFDRIHEELYGDGND